jgi:hypothetical protein
MCSVSLYFVSLLYICHKSVIKATVICISTFNSQRAVTTFRIEVKFIPQQTEVAQGVTVRLRPRSFLTFGTTRVVVRQPYAPAAFTPEENHGYHFQRLSRPQGTLFPRGEQRKKIPSDTTGNRSRDRPTSSAVS